MEINIGKRSGIPLAFFLIISLSFTLSRAASQKGSGNFGCNGTISECLSGDGETEFSMDSDTNRRLLAGENGNYPTTQALNLGAFCDRDRYANCLPNPNPNSNGGIKRECKTYEYCRVNIQ